jgi:hypothetical protein
MTILTVESPFVISGATKLSKVILPRAPSIVRSENVSIIVSN